MSFLSKNKVFSVGFILAVCLLSSCGVSASNYIYTQPPDLEDGIATNTLAYVSMDEKSIKKLMNSILDGKLGETHSILVYKNGALVLEEYFEGYDYKWGDDNFHGDLVEWDETRRHNIHSVGKSITSACVGIAIDQGFIFSVHDPIFDYLPDYNHLNFEGKAEITIEHLLTMTSGLAWDEWGTSYASTENDVIRLWLDCDDPLTCILEKKLINIPGSKFNYSSGDLILLGEIIRNSTGLDIESFSYKYLFEPLGVDNPPWSWIDERVIYSSGDQMLTPREMLKFGVLYLNGGVWKEKRIITKGWVDMSAHPFSNNAWKNSRLKAIPPGEISNGNRGYGYTWWTHEFSQRGKPIPVYFALGFGGQKIFVLPKKSMVVVITSGNYNTKDYSTTIFEDYILSSFDTD